MQSLAQQCMNVIITTENFVQLNSDALKSLPLEVLKSLLDYTVHTVQQKSITQVIAFKVRLIRNRLVTFRFKLHGTVQQTIAEIFDKYGIDGSGKEHVEHYGLFQEKGNFRNARWLREDRTLSYYGIQPGDILDFKLKQNIIRIHFWGPWATVKTFIIDESKTVGDLTEEVAQKLEVKYPEEYSLQHAIFDENGSVRYAWLDPTLSLPEQGIDTLNTTLLFRKKEFLREWTVEELEDDLTLTRAFCAAIDVIIGGTTPCSLKEAIIFAALQCQIRFGDCNPSIETLDCNWQEYFPPEHRGLSRKLEKEFLAEYKRLAGMTAANAKFRYLLHTRSLPSASHTFFRVEYQPKDQLENVLLGISKEKITLLHPETMETLATHPLSLIVKWTITPRSLILLREDFPPMEYFTRDPGGIAQVLRDYVSFTTQTNAPIAEFRPGSRPSSPSLSLKDRNLVARKLGNGGKSISFEEPTNLPLNPHLKKSPIYKDPLVCQINPLCVNGLGKFDGSEEVNYYLRMIRNLTCLTCSFGKHRREQEIRVQFPDKSLKEFTVNEAMTVSDVTQEIGESVGIKNPEEFSLQREGDVWLNPYQTLKSQGVGETEIIFFKKKFFYNDGIITNSDPVYFNLLFCQSRDAIRNGTYPCTLHEAVQLAATQFQINFGDYNPAIHKPGFLKANDLKFFLPESLEHWGVSFYRLEKMIYKEHRKLRGIKEEFAKYRYLQLCRSLRTYGIVFFPAKLTKSHRRFPSEQILLGFSRDTILFLTNNMQKEVLVEYPLSHLKKWEGTSSSFMLDFGDYDHGTFVFATEGEVISKYLSDYLDFIQKTNMATQTFNFDLCQYPPRDPTTNVLLDPRCCWEVTLEW